MRRTVANEPRTTRRALTLVVIARTRGIYHGAVLTGVEGPIRSQRLEGRLRGVGETDQRLACGIRVTAHGRAQPHVGLSEIALGVALRGQPVRREPHAHRPPVTRVALLLDMPPALHALHQVE